jgi:hypothetical protein
MVEKKAAFEDTEALSRNPILWPVNAEISVFLYWFYMLRLVDFVCTARI